MKIFDGHIDTLSLMVSRGVLLQNLTDSHVNLEKLSRGSVAAQIFAIFIDPQFLPEKALSSALAMIAAFWETAKTSQRVGLVRGPQDIEKLNDEGKIAGILSLEGGEPLMGKLYLLDVFYQLGVRAITLTWNNRNELADGVGEGVDAGGLSTFGKQVVQRMNELGMVVDVSHLSEKGFWDVKDLSKDPIIASHSNAKALNGHRRNLTDAQIRAIAETGGVIGVNFCPAFLMDPPKKAQMSDVIDQITYLAKVGGVDCVGLGSDYDGIDQTPIGLEDASCFPKVGSELSKRGFSESHIERILFGNFLRVFRSVL